MMLVNPRSAQRCCKYCDTDYGPNKGSRSNKERNKFRRTIKRRDRQAWKREIQWH